MVIERSEPAAVNNFSGFVDDVNALRPATVEAVSGIAHSINGDGNWIMEAAHKIVGDGDTLSERFGLRVANVFSNIRLHLPLVLRVRLANIHSQEVSAIFVIVINLGEIPDLAAKWRSSVATENKDQRAFANPIVHIHCFLAIEGKYSRIGGLVADA